MPKKKDVDWKALVDSIKEEIRETMCVERERLHFLHTRLRWAQLGLRICMGVEE